MDNKAIEKNEEIEIDLKRVFSALRQKFVWIVAVSVACAIIFCLGTVFFITSQYEAAAKFYVNNSSISVGGASVSISSGDLVTSRNLVDSYIVILKTRETLNDVIDYAGADRTYSEVARMIDAKAVDETEIFQVTVTSPDPQEAEKIANAIAYILPKRIGNIIEGTSAKVVEAAIVPANPSSPSYVSNTVIGCLLGIVLTAAVIALQEIFDVTIRTEEDIAQSCNQPVLAAEGEFVPSISYKDAPVLVSVTLDGENVELCLIVTSILDAVNETTDIFDEDRAFLLSIYEQLLNGTMKLPLENDYVIRDLVDVSLTKTCVTSDDNHQEKLEKADTAMEVVFNLGSTDLTGLVVMHYDEDEWKPVEFKNNGDGTITCWFEDFCPVVFAVESEGPDVPITADSMTATMWIGMLTVSAAAVFVIVANRRKIFG